MYQLETQIDIEAPVERVWSLLADFSSYPEWNPFVRSIEGDLVVGESLKLFLQPPGGKGMQFRPVVLTAEPNREFRWKGRLFLPGIFDGEHYFQLDAKPGAGIIFRHGEIFTGILVPIFRRSLDNDIKQGFIAMNEALKREAEKS